MTHEIEGIIIPSTHPARQLNGFRSAVRKTLRQGMMFIPLGDALIGEIGRDAFEAVGLHRHRSTEGWTHDR